MSVLSVEITEIHLKILRTLAQTKILLETDVEAKTYKCLLRRNIYQELMFIPNLALDL